MATRDDLQHAFAGESQANRKYLAFAQQAEADGLPEVARLFRAAAAAETIHALAHLKAMGGIGTTAANLAAAAEGERYEYQEMYPPFLAAAEQAGEKAATRSFRQAMAAEEVHCQLYRAALAAVQQGQDLPARQVYLCPICGNLEYGEPPAKCSICGAVGSKFTAVA
jgi:rubrerythrin